MEERRGANDIADRTKFDDEDILCLLFVMQTHCAARINAMHTVLFVRFARHVAAEPFAIGLECACSIVHVGTPSDMD